jgi:hypothetical protein
MFEKNHPSSICGGWGVKVISVIAGLNAPSILDVCVQHFHNFPHLKNYKSYKNSVTILIWALHL